MKINTNICTAVLFLLFGIFLRIVLPTQVPASNEMYGPRLFPTIVIGIMLLASVGILIQEFLRLRKNKMINQLDEIKPDIIEISKYELSRVGLMFIIMTGYIFLMEPLGFILASILFVCTMLIFFRSKKIVYYSGISTGIIIIIYYSFQYFLKVYLP